MDIDGTSLRNLEIEKSLEDEIFTIIQTGSLTAGKNADKAANSTEDQLVDTTEPLQINSKRSRRLQNKQRRRQEKASPRIQNFLELPTELLQEILGYLRPSDVFSISQLNRATNNYVQKNEKAIARDIIGRRYWVLSHCFPLPKFLKEVDEQSRVALSHPRREKMTEVHKKPYQHIKPPDSRYICTCSSCLLNWNNLNICLDLAHWQWNLNHKEPIPVLPRGSNPAWNADLIGKHATIVEKAMSSQLTYAAILEKHLNTITGTLLRQTRFPTRNPMHRHNKAVPPPKAVHPILLYRISETDAAKEDDEYLERQGKESYELPFSRDNYYNNSMLAYLPNRRWSKERHEWLYYASGGHERDLEWTRKWFLPASTPSSAYESTCKTI
ncbi:hypothetical protein M433DRAFT_298404 [Acidomyces richmondensis BFW]|nr:MAG: hypothetical protein FE78DRAFT_475130 [Acidomyces sp. 'richmondensis']KYG49491.1 hypothetical protein M433DRAFT_298404 [Acidomyces richmondensis BFW]